MKKILKWLYANKITISGFLALILYFVDSIFNITTKYGLPKEWYYTLVALIFVLIGYALKGRGIESVEVFEEVERQRKVIKGNTSLLEKMLKAIFKREDDIDDIEKKHFDD